MRHAAAEGCGVISTAWCSHVHLNKHTGVLCMSPPSIWDRRGRESQMFIVFRNGTGVEEGYRSRLLTILLFFTRAIVTTCGVMCGYYKRIAIKRASENASSANTCAQQQMGVYRCFEIFSAVCTVLHRTSIRANAVARWPKTTLCVPVAKAKRLMRSVAKL